MCPCIGISALSKRVSSSNTMEGFAVVWSSAPLVEIEPIMVLPLVAPKSTAKNCLPTCLDFSCFIIKCLIVIFLQIFGKLSV